MNLTDYINQIGRKEAMRLFGVGESSISHWMNGRRKPSTDLAKVIIANSPVTWEGIYGPLPESARDTEAA